MWITAFFRSNYDHSSPWVKSSGRELSAMTRISSPTWVCALWNYRHCISWPYAS